MNLIQWIAMIGLFYYIIRGILKREFFALIIASIGIYQVLNNNYYIVLICIIAIIILDFMFELIFKKRMNDTLSIQCHIHSR